MMMIMIITSTGIMKKRREFQFYPVENKRWAENINTAINSKGPIQLGELNKNCSLTESMIWYLQAQRAEEGGDPLSKYLKSQPKNQMWDCAKLYN